MENTIEAIKSHPVYKQIMADSFNGVMYNVANRNKYDSAELVTLWQSMSDDQQACCDGIVKGAMNFITGN